MLLAIHEEQATHFGGSIGLRDRGLLESAIARPQQARTYEILRPDVCALSALYTIAIVKNHPFVDGNKRVGFIALQTFLEMNGYDFTATDASVVTNVLGLAAGTLGEHEFMGWVKRHCIARSSGA